MKRALESGENRLVKQQKCELDWVGVHGWNFFKHVISLIIFEGERPLNRLYLVCKKFKEFFDHEIGNYFGALASISPYAIAMITSMERFKNTLCFYVDHENKNLAFNERCLSVYMEMDAVYGWTFRNFRSGEQGINEELLVIDPEAQIPFAEEWPCKLDGGCKFLWLADKIKSLFGDHKVLLEVSDPLNAAKEDLHFFVYEKPVSSHYEEFITSFIYDLDAIFLWCMLERNVKETWKAIHKWESKFQSNAMKKAKREHASFKGINGTSFLNCLLRSILASNKKDGHRFSILFGYWKQAIERIECWSSAQVIELDCKIHTILCNSETDIEKQKKLFEEGRRIDWEGWFSFEDDYDFLQHQREMLGVLHRTLLDWWNNMFRSFDTYLLAVFEW